MSSNTLVLDFHGWSTALSRAALRYVLKQFKSEFENGFPVRRLTILTGKGYSKSTPVLRPAVTKMLQTEFNPPLAFSVSNGVITVDEANVMHWIRHQQEQQQAQQQARLRMSNSRMSSRSSNSADQSSVEDLLFPPRFYSRFEQDDPLYWSHNVLGRDDSPPVSYINGPIERTPPVAIIPGYAPLQTQISL